MIRQIIEIDKDKCNGCGLCVSACHEGAIGLEDGKAVLLRDDYCDGLGNCLPVCPTGAISFTQREAADFDEEAVKQSQQNAKQVPKREGHTGCPGTQARMMQRESTPAPKSEREEQTVSELRQWPVQIKLVPVNAPYFNGSHLLIAADCTAYAYASFHQKFMRNRITLIGCPKLDEGSYADKLTAIIKNNNIKSVTVARMEVPCCSGIEHAVITALKNSGKTIPWQVSVISTDGEILED